jgi:uncharacterized protein YqgC (DUF456 family)
MNADVLLISLSIILCIIGIVGCIIPGLPGTPFNYAGMLIVHWRLSTFETSTLIIFGILTAAVLVIDYMLPVWFAKKFGATKQGIWGSIIGMLLGFLFTPIGMILGMLIGAIAGDMLAGRTSGEATRSGIATFFGTLLSIGIKLGVSLVISVLVFYESYRFYI